MKTDQNLVPYFTVAADCHCEIAPIKGSRFIGFARRVSSDEAAVAAVAAIKSDYPDARHWCWAYQLKAQRRTRFSDDGEPSGSAGKPILAPIVGRELVDVMVVVVRYFGGVKLGVGGLVRAYSQAANAVLESAGIIKVIPTVTLQLDYGYQQSTQIASALASLSLDEENPQYSDRVVSTIEVTPDAVEAAISRIRNYTGGKACVKILQSRH